MSFITKRERVFHDADLCDLPPRNEGKLKAYASCTDARAWSHFGSSKTEHLTELIKKNNDLAAVKYVPMKVIVDTLTASKNLEIARLKRKIGEFEQMLAVYDELELNCEQKCEIAKAHAAIKAANKDLDDMCLNLDISTCTDGFETESFETGKSRSVQYSGNWSIKSKGGESDRSRGDAWTVMLDKDMASQGNQTSVVCPCDACVSVEDSRIDEMKEQIISKDAKLNAMRNSLAIMENDICEPFGIYAHIYTALEKIYGILSQNSKYKQFLNLMTAGKDTRCIDIKGKILFKMKVLEKFCLALIAPCSKEFNCSNAKDCPCFYADISTKIENTYRITPTDSTSVESIKRSQLVADIMENEEMKEILSKESTPNINDDSEPDKVLDTASTINVENQKRIKDLQDCYDELLHCYENLKHETDCIRIRCSKYEDLELELERLRGQLNEYNSLWNEKEHYRKRSSDLDSLKQQYMVLAEESSNLETKLKAETEINHIKADAIDELRTQNISLEKKLNEIYISFEKDKNDLQCQLQESECKCMCQAQQIKSLNSQIMQLLEREHENIPHEDTTFANQITEENELLKEQLKQYQDIEYEFQDKMIRINELEADIARWRAEYEKVSERNKYLQDCIENHESEKQILGSENKALLDAIRERTDAVENLMGVVNIKSLEIRKLTEENQHFNNQLKELGEKYENHLRLSRQESQELLRKVKDYDDFVLKQEDLSNEIAEKMQEYECLKLLLKQKQDENENLKIQLNILQDQDVQSKKSLEITTKESSILERKLSELEDISKQFLNLKDAFEKLSVEKQGLEGELRKKASQLESAIYSVKLNKKESGELLKQSESIKDELFNLHSTNNTLKKQIDQLVDINKELETRSRRIPELEEKLANLKKHIDSCEKEKESLQHTFNIKDQELNHLYSIMESKIEENQALNAKLETLGSHHLVTSNNLSSLEKENEQHQTELNKYKRESSILVEKLQGYTRLEDQFRKLQTDHEAMKLEKYDMEKKIQAILSDLQGLQEEKVALQHRIDYLLAQSNDLEKALMASRNELLSAQSTSKEETPYANLMEEIRKMRIEKAEGLKKIRDLRDKLDEMDQEISNFDNEVHARDNKIATMQNHINNLEDEVRRLQILLDQALDAGYDMRNTNNSIEESRKLIEAHHSKASHNMKLELAVLQRSKSKLENELLATKSQYETSFKDKKIYLSEINDLKNDREIIITDIKQLETYAVGDSVLTSDDCEIELVLQSIDRIRKAFDAKYAKTVSLEQTLAKVQSSSHLFLNKADEAKMYFESEKQKLLSEKEAAIQGKQHLEKQLYDLKEQLKKQISQDGDMIKDLQGEISNQKLIFDKINESTTAYISKLENEIQGLKDLYQKALSRIRELEEKLNKTTTEKDLNASAIQELILDLENKTKEVSQLKSKLSDLGKDYRNKSVQYLNSNNCKDVSSQTDNVQHHAAVPLPDMISADRLSDNERLKVNKSEHDSARPMYDLLPQQKHPSVNEVQILSAKVEPTFDFVRSSYLNYKIKRLGPGLLEHHSIPSLTPSASTYNEDIPENSNYYPRFDDSHIPQNLKVHSSNEDLVDIYQSPSDNMQSSSKMIGITTQNRGPAYNAQRDNADRPEMRMYNNNVKAVKPIHNYSDSQKIANPRNETVYKNKVLKQDYDKPREIRLESIIKIMDDNLSSLGPKNEDEGYINAKSIVTFESDIATSLVEQEAYKAKPKLKIDLPRVGVESNSLMNTLETDNNSLDSYSLASSHPMKGTLSDTTVLMPSSGEYNFKSVTPSLPTISKLRSYIELPSKDSSFTKSSSLSENRSSNDKTYDNLDHFVIFGDPTTVRTTEPQKIFSLVEKIQKLDPTTHKTSVHFEIKDPKTRISNRSEDSFNKSDDSKDLPFIMDTNQRKTASKTPYQEKLYDEFDRLISSDNVKLNSSKVKPRRFTEDSNNNTNESISKIHGRNKGSNSNIQPQFVDKEGRSYKRISKKNQGKAIKMSTDKNTMRHNETDSGSGYTEKRGMQADPSLKVLNSSSSLHDDNSVHIPRERGSDFALSYILDSFKPDAGKLAVENVVSNESDKTNANSWIGLSDSNSETDKNYPKLLDQSVMANLDMSSRYYEDVIATLRKSLIEAEKDHKTQMQAIKIQYDRNINSIISEHNQGVRNIQNLHEETLRDVMRVHENEVESLRSMSIDAMRKVEKLEKECSCLKSKMSLDSSLLDEIPTKCLGSLEVRKPGNKPHSDAKVLTKTNIEAFNVKPKMRVHGPCTCSLDINISDTIRNIFEQVDVEQRKMAETTYLRYIASKITNGQIETLDTQELSFLHLKVCRTWKQKLNKEETLQKKIDSLEVELIKKQRSAQQHMADLDRKVAQEKKRLEEVREAVCRSTPSPITLPHVTPSPTRMSENRCSCTCDIERQEVAERRSAGDLAAATVGVTRMKKTHRGAVPRIDGEERRDRRLYTDEPPTRLRRQHDRPPARSAKK